MASLDSLPIEVLTSVLSELPNRAIKNLRLASKYFRDVAPLRLDRVFLSPHPRDVEIFEAIAADDTFCQHIFEIVYDDTRFHRDYAPWEVHDRDEYDWFGGDEYSEGYDPPPGGVPRWYYEMYKENVVRIVLYGHDGHGSKRLARPDLDELVQRLNCKLSPEKSYELYQSIVEDQEKGIEEEADRKALELGLKRFPNLRRVTVTPVAHGIPFMPWYGTPLIRSFPPGFVYPIPYGWPQRSTESDQPFAGAWHDEDERYKWRGLCLVLLTLAKHPHNVTEFVLDTNKLYTGFNAHMFDEPNAEYSSLVSLLQRPGFSHLDMALFAGGGESVGWPWYRNGLIKHALIEAKDLRYVSLSGNANSDSFSVNDPGAEEHLVPLRSIFPVEQWTKLVHFGMSGFVVFLDDLCGFLFALPRTLRSVKLSSLSILRRGGGDHSHLLVYMRDELGWRHRTVLERPRITMHIDQDETRQGCEGDFIDVSSAVESFVYGDGRNPFGEPGEKNGSRGNMVFREDETGVRRNHFNPANDLLFAYDYRLMDLGLVQKSDSYLRGEHLQFVNWKKTVSSRGIRQDSIVNPSQEQ